MLYTQGRSGLKIEAEQLALAIKLDMTYTKKQILRMYAGVVYFGNGYYGLAAASCGYFDVRPAGLSWPEAALLAGKEKFVKGFTEKLLCYVLGRPIGYADHLTVDQITAHAAKHEYRLQEIIQATVASTFFQTK